MALSQDYTKLKITNLNIDNEQITFRTNKVNYPHLIKVSYFPNWQIKEGYGPYRVSPSFIAVVPTSSDVKLVFETSFYEKILDTVSIISLGLALFLFRKKHKENV